MRLEKGLQFPFSGFLGLKGVHVHFAFPTLDHSHWERVVHNKCKKEAFHLEKRKIGEMAVTSSYQWRNPTEQKLQKFFALVGELFFLIRH